MTGVKSGRWMSFRATGLTIHRRCPLSDPFEKAAEVKRVFIANKVSDILNFGICPSKILTRFGNFLLVKIATRTLAGKLSELLREIGVRHASNRRQFVDTHVGTEVIAHHRERARDPGRG